ncbi:MAG: amidohydrolase family protein [Candidatus Diapherotrites archaeon]|nr:amidohydrolase family protein [Candidatus Diapherotrites archaeon]
MQKMGSILGLLVLGILLAGCTTQPPASQENISQQSTSRGCQYNNPSCGSDYNCVDNQCELKSGCQYNNPACTDDYNCLNNQCTLKKGCQYNNSSCEDNYDCINNQCVLTVVNSLNSCSNQVTDTEHMDIFDSHVHIMSKVSASQIISEMDKAGASMSLLYPIDGDDDSSSLDAISQYPGRFIAFVDTPDSPQPATWLTQGQSFVTHAEAQLRTGKFYGIGETNLRYYSGDITPPPTVYVPADTPVWLQLVDLSAQYQAPISFHFVPDDTVANAAFEKMLSYNKDATLIWAHLGFNNMPLDHNALNDYLLRYPNLYFDTAGIQNMQNPLPQSNSNWALLANKSNNGQLNEDWKQFFETWNSRILFGSDAGGGSNGLERWLNYTDNTSNGAPQDAIGHWKGLFANLEYNAARNILSGNARTLFLKEQKQPYDYLVSSYGKCYHILVNSTSSVSALTFNQSTKAITFTVAGSNGTTGSAIITIPATLVGGNFTAQVDGQNVQIKEDSNSTDTTINLEYAGGIRTIALQGKKI